MAFVYYQTGLTLPLHILDVPCSNLVPEAYGSVQGFHVFPRCLQAKFIKLGLDLFLPHILQFIIHSSSYHLTLEEPEQLNRYSYGLDDRGSVPGRSNRFFSIQQCPDRLWGPSSLLYSGYRGLKADHSPPSSADVKNAWIYTSTPPYVFMA
jgi:hypothetical protein